MEISIYFLKDKKLMIGKLDISLTEKSEDIFNNCLEIVSEMSGILIYVTSEILSNWWKIKLFELDSLCLANFSKNKTYLSFLEIKEIVGVSEAKKYIIDFLEENDNEFTNYLKSLKIKRINEK